jgi:hypothetical protein
MSEFKVSGNVFYPKEPREMAYILGSKDSWVILDEVEYFILCQELQVLDSMVLNYLLPVELRPLFREAIIKDAALSSR